MTTKWDSQNLLQSDLITVSTQAKNKGLFNLSKKDITRSNVWKLKTDKFN